LALLRDNLRPSFLDKCVYAIRFLTYAPVRHMTPRAILPRAHLRARGIFHNNFSDKISTFANETYIAPN